MNFEKDTILEFIEWLKEVKNINLVGPDSDFIVPWWEQGDNTERLEGLIEEWGNDIETNL